MVVQRYLMHAFGMKIWHDVLCSLKLTWQQHRSVALQLKPPTAAARQLGCQWRNEVTRSQAMHKPHTV
jgi:hypothetical protein